MLEGNLLGEILTLSLMGLALGLDAFSVCIGLGMRGIRLRHVLKLSVVNGLSHMLMPLAGIILGGYLSMIIGHLAVYLGGGLLILFGINMIYSSYSGEEKQSWIGTTGWGLVLFSLSVSLDSFSVGLSLGLFSMHMWISIVLFGLSSLLLTAVGLLIGRRTAHWVGSYSEAIGGMILLVFGLKFLL